MKKNEAMNVGDIIRKYLREEGLETPLNEYRLIQSWPMVVGSEMSAYTSNLFIKKQSLFVHVSSPVVRQELMMRREYLVKVLNEQVGALVIINIIFR